MSSCVPIASGNHFVHLETTSGAWTELLAILDSALRRPDPPFSVRVWV